MSVNYSVTLDYAQSLTSPHPYLCVNYVMALAITPANSPAGSPPPSSATNMSTTVKDTPEQDSDDRSQVSADSVDTVAYAKVWLPEKKARRPKLERFHKARAIQKADAKLKPTPRLDRTGVPSPPVQSVTSPPRIDSRASYRLAPSEVHIDDWSAFVSFLQNWYVFGISLRGVVTEEMQFWIMEKINFLQDARKDDFNLTTGDVKFLEREDSFYTFLCNVRPSSYRDRQKAVAPHIYYLVHGTYQSILPDSAEAQEPEKKKVRFTIDPPLEKAPNPVPPPVTSYASAVAQHLPNDPDAYSFVYSSPPLPRIIRGPQRRPEKFQLSGELWSERDSPKVLRLLSPQRQNKILACYRKWRKLRQDRWLCILNGPFYLLQSSRRIDRSSAIVQDWIRRADIFLMSMEATQPPRKVFTLSELLVSPAYLPFAGSVYQSPQELEDFLAPRWVTSADHTVSHMICSCLSSAQLTRADLMFLLSDVLLRGLSKLQHSGFRSVFLSYPNMPSASFEERGDVLGVRYINRFVRLIVHNIPPQEVSRSYQGLDFQNCGPLVALFSTMQLLQDVRTVPSFIALTCLCFQSDLVGEDVRTVLVEQVTAVFDGFREVQADNFIESVFKSDLSNKLFEIFSCFSLAGIFNAISVAVGIDAVQNISRALLPLLKFQPGKGSSLDIFVEKVYAFVSLFMTRLRNAVSQRDIRQLFVDTPSVSNWAIWVDSTIDDDCLREDIARPSVADIFTIRRLAGYYSPRVTRPLDIPGRIVEVDELISTGERLKKETVEPHVLSLLRNKLDRLRNEARSLMVQQANASYRITPFGLFIHGFPGVGKTTLCERLHSVFGQKLELQSDPTTMYRMDAKSNYHDSFTNGMWGVLFDDIDQSVAPESAAMMNHTEIVNKLINSAPYPMEKADVSEKGKFFANFVLAYYCTNFSNGNLRDKTLAPLQFWRRFPLRIGVSVLPAFATPSGQIDPDKVGENTDILHYTVEEFAPTENDRSNVDTAPYRMVLETSYEPDLMIFLLARFEKHMAEQKKNMARNLVVRQAPEKCASCYLPLKRHRDGLPCRTVKLQGLESYLYTIFPPYLLLSLALYGAWPLLSTTLSVGGEVLHKAVSNRLYWAVVQYVGIGVFTLSYFQVTSPRYLATLYRACDFVVQQQYSALLEKLSSKAVKLAIGALVVALPVAFKLYRSKTWQGIVPKDVPELPRKRDVWHRLPPTMWEREYSLDRKPSFTRDEFARVLAQRLFRVRGVIETNGLMLKGGVAIFPKHALLGNTKDCRQVVVGPTTFEVFLGSQPHGRWTRLDLAPDLIHYLPGRDLILARILEIPVTKSNWNLVDHIPPTCFATSRHNSDDSLLVVSPSEQLTSSSRVVPCSGYYKTTGELASWAGKFSTKPGDCGSPLVLTFADRFYLAGFHGIMVNQRTALGLPDFFTIAESIGRDEISGPLAAISATLPGSFETVFDPSGIDPTIDALQFHELPPRSSLGVAITRSPEFQGMIFGESDRKFGSTMKTSVVPTPFLPSIREISPYQGEEAFSPPQFSGFMLDGVWTDPHVRSLMTYNNEPGREILWRAAVGDYVSGIGDLSGWSSLVPLSDYATMIGVDGTTVGGFNMRTSAGLPFRGSKRVCCDVDREGPVPAVFLSPALRTQMDKILAVVDSGDLYSPIAQHTLKDEVVTVAKNKASKVRVFNVMGFAFNALLKKYISPLVSVFREHPSFFESAIGLNISGLADGTMIYNRLLRFENWMASDVSNFDTTASTSELYHACTVVMIMASHTSYSATDKRRLWGLLMSSIHVTHIVKGDFLFTNYTLASGYWITLFLNCIRNSLQARYAFYHLRPASERRCFRDLCVQYVLGDDNVATVSREAPWYNQVTIAASVASFGSKRSSSDKTAVLREYEPRDNVSFLKRRPWIRNGTVVWAIEEKTLWRMLSYRVSSTLSEHDHAAVILSVVCAEASLHPKERFEFFRNLAEDLALSYEISGPFLITQDYAWYENKYLSNSLVVWDPTFNNELDG